MRYWFYKMVDILFTVVLLNQRLVSAVNISISPRQESNARIILQQQMTAPGPGLEILAVTAEITLPPGDSGPLPHIHSGPGVVYVIQGEFLFQVHGKPRRIIQAGEAFYEVAGDIHVWNGNASNSTVCKITATTFGRPGEDFVTFLKDYKRESRDEAIAAAKREQNTSDLNTLNVGTLKGKADTELHKYIYKNLAHFL